MSIETIIGIAASILSAIASIPQLVKVIREKNADSISLPMLAILIAGLSLWVIYGIYREDPIIIASNAFAALVNSLLAGWSIYLRK